MGWPNLNEAAPSLSDTFLGDTEEMGQYTGPHYDYDRQNLGHDWDLFQIWNYADFPLSGEVPDYQPKFIFDAETRAMDKQYTVSIFDGGAWHGAVGIWNQRGQHLGKKDAEYVVWHLVNEYEIDIEELFGEPIRPAVVPLPARAGFIYLIEGIDTGTFKIGRTAKLSERLNAFGVLLPFETALIHSFPAKDMFHSESRLHRRFKNKRVRSEWFSLDPAQVEYIKSIKSE